jgi:hypothetical protein
MNAYTQWTKQDWIRHYAGPQVASAGLISDTRLLFPWGDDIPQAKIRVDAKYKSVMRDVDACAALSPTDKQAFHAEYDAWRRFFCSSANLDCQKPAWSHFGLGSQMDEIEKWESDRLFLWQQRLQGRCAMTLPAVRPKHLAESARESGASEEKMLKYGAIAIGAVALAYLLGPAARAAGSRIAR